MDIGIAANLDGQAVALLLGFLDLADQSFQRGLLFLQALLGFGNASRRIRVAIEHLQPGLGLTQRLLGVVKQLHNRLVLGRHIGGGVFQSRSVIVAESVLQNRFRGVHISLGPLHIIRIGGRSLTGSVVSLPCLIDFSRIAAGIGIFQLLLGLFKGRELGLDGLRRLQPFLCRLVLRVGLGKGVRLLRQLLLGLGHRFLCRGDCSLVAACKGLGKGFVGLGQSFLGILLVLGRIGGLRLGLGRVVSGIGQLLLPLGIHIIVHDGVPLGLQFIQNRLLGVGVRQLLTILSEQLRQTGIGSIQKAAADIHPQVALCRHVFRQ